MFYRAFVVDAFADTVFAGNPAAIVLVERWPTYRTMLHVADEFNVSESAFVVPRGNAYAIRWFSPTQEVAICGHATIAAAHVLCTEYSQGSIVNFRSRTMSLAVRRTTNGYALEMPIVPHRRCEQRFNDTVAEALEHFCSFENIFARLPHYDAVRNYVPNFVRLAKLHPYGVVITAPGRDEDFVSRYFAPSYGIPEDHVTGSIHATLAPYWGATLQKSVMVATQLSRRGGRLFCAVRSGNVVVVGNARTFLRGTIQI